MCQQCIESYSFHHRYPYGSESPCLEEKGQMHEPNCLILSDLCPCESVYKIKTSPSSFPKLFARDQPLLRFFRDFNWSPRKPQFSTRPFLAQIRLDSLATCFALFALFWKWIRAGPILRAACSQMHILCIMAAWLCPGRFFFFRVG